MDTTNATAVYLRIIKEKRDKLERTIKRYQDKLATANLELTELNDTLEAAGAKTPTKK